MSDSDPRSMKVARLVSFLDHKANKTVSLARFTGYLVEFRLDEPTMLLALLLFERMHRDRLGARDRALLVEQINEQLAFFAPNVRKRR